MTTNMTEGWTSESDSSSSPLDDRDWASNFRSFEEANDPFALHKAAEDGDFGKVTYLIGKDDADSSRPKDYWGCAPVHNAVFSANIECFMALAAWPGSEVDQVRCQGSPLPHVILAVAGVNRNFAFARAALAALLEANKFSLLVESKDEYERTPLFLACELGLEVEILEVLLDALELLEDEDAKNRVLRAVDKFNRWTFMHVAAARASTDAARTASVFGEIFGRKYEITPELVNAKDVFGRSITHVYVRATGLPFLEEDPVYRLFAENGVSFTTQDELGRTPFDYAHDSALQRTKRRGPTIVYSHEVCSRHFTAPEEDTKRPYYSKKDVPPENVNRLLVLLHEKFGTLRARTFGDLVHDRDAPKAQLGDVLKVHEWGYVQTLKNKCDALDEHVLGDIDGDTTFSKNTFEASLRACGSAIAGVDAVMGGKSENVFCAVRPPGHHAGPSGLVADCSSHGFCFLNNVAIAAAYALNRHRDAVKRVAIVDFDVHHGNGTEVCVEENLKPGNVRSTFHIPLGGHGVCVAPRWKPWLGDEDVENVFFCSVHGYGKDEPGRDLQSSNPPFYAQFYPGSGKDRLYDPLVLDVGQNSRSRQDWRGCWRDHVFGRLRAFKPDLIIISAGFDAHAKDTINHGFCGALEIDYEWLTRSLVCIANESCDGRIVSVLEGGYRIQGRSVSAFARSVADHVRVLAEARPTWGGLDLDEIELDRKKVAEEKAARAAAVLAMQESAHCEEEEEEEEEEGEEEGDNRDGTFALLATGASASSKPTPANTAVPPAPLLPVGDSSRRRARKDIDFVKLNEQYEREKEAKKMKQSE